MYEITTVGVDLAKDVIVSTLDGTHGLVLTFELT